MKKLLLAMLVCSGMIFADDEDESLSIQQHLLVNMVLDNLPPEAQFQLPQAKIDPTPLLNLLKDVQPIIAGVNPTPDDVAVVVKLIEPDIALIKAAKNDPVALQNALVSGFQKLKTYFYTDQLTIGQKSALYYLMQTFATKL